MNRDLLNRIIDKYGPENQMHQCIEEMAELTQAINKHLRADNPNTLKNVIEEIADVEIMIGQMRLIFGDFDVYVSKRIKLKRMEQRLAEESKDQKTILQDFLEKHPNATVDDDGTPVTLCPHHLGHEQAKDRPCKHNSYNCLKCWSRPLEG